MPELDLQSLSDWLSLHPNWILFALCLAAFVESLAIAGIIVPGVAILFAIAVVAGSSGLSLFSALSAAFVGAVLGDVLSFFLGYHYRDRLRKMWPVSRYPAAMATGEQFFAQHGGKSVVIGRFVGPIRPVLPLVAGMLAMSPLRFVAINIASAIAWAPTYILPGFLVGTAIELQLPPGAAPLTLGLLGCLALLAVIFSFASRNLQHGQGWYEGLNRIGVLGSINVGNKPLASLVLFIVSVLFFVFWSYISLRSSWLADLNQRWLQLALALDIPSFREGLTLITMFGDERLLQFSFTLLVLALAWVKRYWSALLVAVSGLALSAITHGLKEWFGIERPDVFIEALGTLAYPSGHSSGAMVLFGLLATILAQQSRPSIRWQIYLVLFVPALCIALSRVLLGAHWFTDIIGGLSLGLAVCSAARVIYWFGERRLSTRIQHTNQGPLVDESQRLSGKWVVTLSLTWLTMVLVYLLNGYEDAFMLYRLSVST